MSRWKVEAKLDMAVTRRMLKVAACALLQIYGEEGIKGFYRGCTANLLRTTPAAALTFTTFELLSREMKEMGARQREKEREEECACQPQGASTA